VANTYLLANASLEFTNTSNNNYTVSSYMIVDGTTSNITNTSLVASNTIGGTTAYASVNISQSAPITTASQYQVRVYAYTNTSSGTNVQNTHCDLFVLGDLARNP